MDHKENDFRKICFQCAYIYELEDEEIIKCPACGKSMQLSEYERIMQGIRQAVFAGWTCRTQYENNDDGMRYYTEHCSEILNFVALAVVSGLIGNLSTDVVKIVIKKICSYLKMNKKKCKDQVLIDFLQSSEKIKKFSEYINAYYNEYDGADLKTKNAILEEVFVDHVSHIIDGLIKRNNKEIDIDKVIEDSPHSREDIMKLVLEIRNKVNSEQLEECGFKDFWSNINID